MGGWLSLKLGAGPGHHRRRRRPRACADHGQRGRTRTRGGPGSAGRGRAADRRSEPARDQRGRPARRARAAGGGANRAAHRAAERPARRRGHRAPSPGPTGRRTPPEPGRSLVADARSLIATVRMAVDPTVVPELVALESALHHPVRVGFVGPNGVDMTVLMRAVLPVGTDPGRRTGCRDRRPRGRARRARRRRRRRRARRGDARRADDRRRRARPAPDSTSTRARACRSGGGWRARPGC